MQPDYTLQFYDVTDAMIRWRCALYTDANQPFYLFIIRELAAGIKSNTFDLKE